MHIRGTTYVVRTYMGKSDNLLIKGIYICIHVQNNILHAYTHSFFFSIKFNMASFTAIPPPSNTPPPLKKNICATEDEEDYLDKAWGLDTDSRLSCQALVTDADLTIEIPKYTINLVSENH